MNFANYSTKMNVNETVGAGVGDDDGLPVNWVKLASAGVMGLVTLGFGLLPLKVVPRLRTSAAQPPGELTAGSVSALSLVNCLAGGIFFATCLLDMLPEVREKIEGGLDESQREYPLAEFFLACGFFAVFWLEETVHTCSRGLVHHHPHHQDPSSCHHDGERRRLLSKVYSTDSDDDRPATAPPRDDEDLTLVVYESKRRGSGSKGSRRATASRQPPRSRSLSSSSTVRHMVKESRLRRLRSFILFLSLSLHTVFEGLALGLRDNSRGVLSLLVAILAHKIAMSFSLGIQVARSHPSTRSVVLHMLVFALLSPIGAGVGAALTWNSAEGGEAAGSGLDALWVAAIEGVAAGTFLYVTFFEIIQHEMNETRQECPDGSGGGEQVEQGGRGGGGGSKGKASGLVKLFCILIGFSLIAVLHLFPWYGHSHSSDQGHDHDHDHGHKH